jgi:transcription termination factor Rho
MASAPAPGVPLVDIAELKQKSVAELHTLAEQLNISNYSGLRKQDLIFRIEQSLLDSDTVIRGEGVLEILPEGYGFLRSQDWNYLYGPDDIYVSPSQIKRFDLRTGDTVMGQVRPPKEGERYLALLKVEQVNFEEPEKPSIGSPSTICVPGIPMPGSGWSGRTATCLCGWSICSVRWARGSVP